MQNLQVKTNSTKTKLYANCPFCVNVGKTPDTKFHLFITPGKAVFCFRCGYKTSFLKLTQNYRIDTSGYKGDVAIAKPDSNFDKDIAKNVVEFNNSMYAQGALNYLHKRKINDSLIKRMCIKLGTERLFGRVVFLDEVNKYYVARSFLPNVDPKTLNPAGANRPLMYLSVPTKSTTLYLVEGCFDAVPFLKTDRNVAVLLGKDISQFQVKQLSSMQIHNIIIALDTDAYASAQKLSGILAGGFPFVNIGIMTYESGRGKDPGDYDVDLFEHTSIYWTRLMNADRR